MKKFILVFIFFFLCLSFSIGQAEETPAPRVLIVIYHPGTGHKGMGHIMAGELSSNGYVTATADTIESALSRWKDFRPDIVMVDIVLPESESTFGRPKFNGGHILLQKAPRDKAKIIDISGGIDKLPDSLVDAVVPDVTKMEDTLSAIETLLSNQRPPKRAPRVLIVKAHIPVGKYGTPLAQIMARDLSSNGYITNTAYNVESALSRWEDFRPDIVITERVLPKNAFAGLHPDGGLILLRKAPKDKAKVIIMGTDEFFRLPYDSLVDAVSSQELAMKEHLLPTIRFLLSEHQTPIPPRRASYKTFGQKCMSLFNVFKKN